MRMAFSENVTPDVMKMVGSGVTAWYRASNGCVRGESVVFRCWLFGGDGCLLTFYLQLDNGKSIVRRGCAGSELHVAGILVVKAKLIFGLVVRVTFPAGKANPQMSFQLGESVEALFV